MLRWNVGDVTITQVVELETASIGSMVLPQATPELVRAIPWLSPHFLDAEGRLLFSINALLVESGGRRIVVDTCLGNDKERPYRAFNMLSGPFLRDLDEAGAPREAVERRRGRSPADRPGRTQRGSACDGRAAHRHGHAQERDSGAGGATDATAVRRGGHAASPELIG